MSSPSIGEIRMYHNVNVDSNGKETVFWGFYEILSGLIPDQTGIFRSKGYKIKVLGASFTMCEEFQNNYFLNSNVLPFIKSKVVVKAPKIAREIIRMRDRTGQLVIIKPEFLTACKKTAGLCTDCPKQALCQITRDDYDVLRIQAISKRYAGEDSNLCECEIRENDVIFLEGVGKELFE
jgi:hypothetical protein